jgi:hypothetical protein
MLAAPPFPAGALLVLSGATFIAGLFGVLGLTLIGMAALLKSAGRPLSERERLAVRRTLGKLAWLAVILVAVGCALDTVWLLQQTSNPFWISRRLWRAGLLVPVALLLFACSRPSTSDRARWLTAILPFLVLVLLTFSRGILLDL